MNTTERASTASAISDEQIKAFKEAFHRTSPGSTGYDEAVRTGLAAALSAPTAQPVGQDWTKPTKYLQRLGDAIALLCGGKRPSDEIISAWLDAEADDLRLQDFAATHGPSWGQGIGVIDAAMTLADQPTEGAAHEFRAAVEPSQAAYDHTSCSDFLRSFFNANGRAPTTREAYRAAFEAAASTPPAPAAPKKLQRIYEPDEKMTHYQPPPGLQPGDQTK